MQLSQRFKQLKKHARFSNCISVASLKKAHSYFKQFQKTKDLEIAKLAFDNINIIVQQVAYQTSRIEPTQWNNLCALHIQLYYLANNINEKNQVMNDDMINEVA